MHPVQFEGSVEIKKPESMTDKECYSVWAKYGFSKLIQVLKGKET